MISTRLRAALLMLWTSAGYLPVPALKLCRPRVDDCGRPSTVSDEVCSGNVVGMPALTWYLCALVPGRNCGQRMFASCGVSVELYGTVVSMPRLLAPLCVSYRPVMCGEFQVW